MLLQQMEVLYLEPPAQHPRRRPSANANGVEEEDAGVDDEDEDVAAGETREDVGTPSHPRKDPCSHGESRSAGRVTGTRREPTRRSALSAEPASGGTTRRMKVRSHPKARSTP